MTSIEQPGGSDACRILGHLWHLVGSVMDEMEPALEDLGMSAKAFFLMIEVGEHPFPAQLARKLHLPPPTVTYLIKQLEEKGFLSRRSEAGDLRKFRLVPTPEGLGALGKGIAAFSAIAAERVGRVAAEELAVFERVAVQLSTARGETL